MLKLVVASPSLPADYGIVYAAPSGKSDFGFQYQYEPVRERKGTLH